MRHGSYAVLRLSAKNRMAIAGACTAPGLGKAAVQLSAGSAGVLFMCIHAACR